VFANSAPKNSDPLSKMHWVGLGYLHNHVFSTRFAHVMALLLGILTTSNQEVAGSNIVIACNDCVPFFVRTVYGPIRSTHSILQGCDSTSLTGRCPYFFFCPLYNWQALHLETCSTT
jgi:hypothetical protein